MPSRPQLPPPNVMIPEIRAPDHTQFFHRELVDRTTARWQQNNPIKRGTLYADGLGADVRIAAAFPTLYFCRETVPIGSNTVAGMTQHDFVVWEWATSPDAESTFNAEVSYLADGVANPVFARIYTIRRDEYDASQTIATGTPLTALIGVQMTNGGMSYKHAEAEFDCYGDGAEVEFVISKGAIISAIVVKEGQNFNEGSEINIVGDGSGATCVPIIQPVEAILTSQKKVEFPDGDPMSHEFVKVLRVYEVLPGPWVPDTRYDNDLGPIQIRRRAVLNTGQLGGVITPTGKRNYSGRDGSSVVLIEIEENWSNGTGVPGPGGTPNPLYPILVLDGYDRDPRGAYQRTSQIVVATGAEVGSLTRAGGIVTNIWYEPYADNPFLLKKFVETWVEVTIDDREVTSQFGGGILQHTETTDEPGAQTVETGYIVTESKTTKHNPHEETLSTKKLSPDSAIPTLELLDGGSGFTAPDPAVTFTGGTGSGAAATAVLGFGIASVTLSASGSNYDVPPLVRALGGGGGGGFLVAVLGFSIASVTVDDGGQDYPVAPGVAITGDGTGATATSTLGFGLGSPLVTNGGSGYDSPPPVGIDPPANGGTKARGHAVLSGDSVVLLVIDDPGFGYELGETPGVQFSIATGGSGAVATVALLPTGSVKRVNVTGIGVSNYTFANVVFSGGGGGSGAAATVNLALTGKVKQVNVVAPGIYKTTPNIEFIPSGTGSGAAGTAALSTTNGSVIGFINFVPGLYTVAPTVVFTPAGPRALYHIGDTIWPQLKTFYTDPVTGIVVNLVTQVVWMGNPYPGRIGYRGPFIEQQKYDRWRSIQINSSVDLTTLPSPEAWNTTRPFNLPPRLLSIEVVWTIAVSKEVQALAGEAGVSVSSGSNGSIIVRSSAGYRGYARAVIGRYYIYGSPLLDLVPKPFVIIPSSGSVVLAATDSATHNSVFLGGGNSFGDRFHSKVQGFDISNHLVGFFNVISTDVINGLQFVSSNQLAQGGVDFFLTHYSQPSSGVAVSPAGTVAVAATGTPSTLKISIPASIPAIFTSGQQLLMEVNVEEWRMGIWVVEQVFITVP